MASSSETPTTSTSLFRKASEIFSTSPISATHGAHQVAQTLTTRIWALSGKVRSTSSSECTSTMGTAAAKKSARAASIGGSVTEREDARRSDAVDRKSVV